MKVLKFLFKWLLRILLIPLTYLMIAFILSFITVNKTSDKGSQSIYLSSNGVHLDIIIPNKNLSTQLAEMLRTNPEFAAFGWGDENFYIHTPTWGDLTFGNAFKAAFLKSNTLMHVTEYSRVRKNWVKVPVTEQQLLKVNDYIFKSFKKTNQGKSVLLENQGYAHNDEFYKANGSYSCFKTCNSWINQCFKQAHLKACLWTPFDFVLIGKHE